MMMKNLKKAKGLRRFLNNFSTQHDLHVQQLILNQIQGKFDILFSPKRMRRKSVCSQLCMLLYQFIIEHFV